jgi:hypothetical protein
MAKILKQVVTQEAIGLVPKRIIVQYFDDVAEEDKQTITNYDDMTTEEKATFDAFITLSESKMV